MLCCLLYCFISFLLFCIFSVVLCHYGFAMFACRCITMLKCFCIAERVLLFLVRRFSFFPSGRTVLRCFCSTVLQYCSIALFSDWIDPSLFVLFIFRVFFLPCCDLRRCHKIVVCLQVGQKFCYMKQCRTTFGFLD